MNVLLQLPEPLATGDAVLLVDMPAAPRIGETVDVDGLDHLLTVTGVRWPVVDVRNRGPMCSFADCDIPRVYLDRARMVQA